MTYIKCSCWVCEIRNHYVVQCGRLFRSISGEKKLYKVCANIKKIDIFKIKCDSQKIHGKMLLFFSSQITLIVLRRKKWLQRHNDKSTQWIMLALCIFTEIFWLKRNRRYCGKPRVIVTQIKYLKYKQLFCRCFGSKKPNWIVKNTTVGWFLVPSMQEIHFANILHNRGRPVQMDRAENLFTFHKSHLPETFENIQMGSDLAFGLECGNNFAHNVYHVYHLP